MSPGGTLLHIAEYIAFKPLQLVSGEERPSLVVMFVNPDQLAALVTLAGFRTGALNASVAPWGAACQSMLCAHAEAEKERPAGVIGFFDISQRGKVARDVLTYTMPYPLFLEMEDSVEAVVPLLEPGCEPGLLRHSRHGKTWRVLAAASARPTSEQPSHRVLRK